MQAFAGASLSGLVAYIAAQFAFAPSNESLTKLSK